MARVKRAVHSKKHRRAVLERGEGVLRQQEPLVPRRQRAGHALAAVRLPRPPGPQGRVPHALDPAHQRRLPPERHQLQPVHRRPAHRRHRGRPQGPRRPRRHRPAPPSPRWSRRRAPPSSRRRQRRAKRSVRDATSRPASVLTALGPRHPGDPATASPLAAPQCASGGRASVRDRGADARRRSAAGRLAPRGDLRRRGCVGSRACRAGHRRSHAACSSGSRRP